MLQIITFWKDDSLARGQFCSLDIEHTFKCLPSQWLWNIRHVILSEYVFAFFLFLTWFPYSFLLLLPNIDILSTEYWREWIFITKRVLSWRKTEFWLFVTKCLEARRETNSRSLDFKETNAWSYYFDWCNMNKGSKGSVRRLEGERTNTWHWLAPEYPDNPESLKSVYNSL